MRTYRQDAKTLELPWPFTGRTEELERVRAALAGGRPGIVVTAPAGHGKTRLITEAVRGLDHARVTGTPEARDLPLAAFAPLLPDTASLHHAVRALSGVRVLVVDDAQLLDETSAALVHQLAVHGRTRLIVAAADGVPAPEAVSRLWTGELLPRLALGPLPREDTARLLAGAELEPLTARRLHQACQGDLRLLRDLLTALTESGPPTSVPGAEPAAADGPVPGPGAVLAASGMPTPHPGAVCAGCGVPASAPGTALARSGLSAAAVPAGIAGSVGVMPVWGAGLAGPGRLEAVPGTGERAWRGPLPVTPAVRERLAPALERSGPGERDILDRLAFAEPLPVPLDELDELAPAALERLEADGLIDVGDRGGVTLAHPLHGTVLRATAGRLRARRLGGAAPAYGPALDAERHTLARRMERLDVRPVPTPVGDWLVAHGGLPPARYAEVRARFARLRGELRDAAAWAREGLRATPSDDGCRGELSLADGQPDETAGPDDVHARYAAVRLGRAARG
ncbi:hypothetical protein, partial [Streptomyces nogalater]